MDYFEETITTGFDPSGTMRVGFDVGRKRMTPNELAALRLYKTLENYPKFTKEARLDIQNEFTDFPDLPILNLELFSSVLAFLHLRPNPTPEDFKDKNIVSYFSRLLPDKNITDVERKRNIVRLKAEFYRYIVAINSYRSEEFE